MSSEDRKRFVRLSTPHGTLGTIAKQIWENFWRIAFNSTRYIRNDVVPRKIELSFGLSTPHGTLGTQ